MNDRTLRRSIDEPIREGLSWHERWDRDDRGLIACWENGRELSQRNPEQADCAKNGELIKLGWVGGVSQKLKQRVFNGTLFYLAKWQGLRGDDLDIDVDGDTVLECLKTGQVVKYNSKLPIDSEISGDVKLI